MANEPKRTPVFIKKRGVGRALVAFVAVNAIAFAVDLAGYGFLGHGFSLPGDPYATYAVALLAAALAYLGKIQVPSPR